jgi:hypothetical protein
VINIPKELRDCIVAYEEYHHQREVLLLNITFFYLIIIILNVIFNLAKPDSSMGP